MRKDRPSGNLSQECHTGVRHSGDESDHPVIAAGPSARPELSGRKFPPGCLDAAAKQHVQMGELEKGGGGLPEGVV